MRHLELFSGIGGFRRALELLTHDGVMDFDSIGYSEIDANAIKTYKENYHPSEKEIFLGDIVDFTQDKNKIKKLPDFDLLTGGFPCQTFSMMGKMAGFAEERGQMFFRIIDILKIKRPRYVILENVKNIYTHDNKRTFTKIQDELHDLDYNVISGIFNTEDFHLPQKRSRVIIFATLDELPINQFDMQEVKNLFDNNYNHLSISHYNTVIDILKRNVDTKYFLSEKIKPTLLSDGSAGFRSKSDINQIIARPLTATMHKMHRACQDNYYSQNFIDSEGRDNPVEYMNKNELSRLAIRKITPEEAFMLQGFPSEFATRARKIGVSNGALYRQAGNAVSINTVYAVMYYLITNNLINE